MTNKDQTTTQSDTSTEPTSPSTELSDDQLEAVSGGRKKGSEQQEYMIIKMTDIIVTG